MSTSSLNACSDLLGRMPSIPIEVTVKQGAEVYDAPPPGVLNVWGELGLRFARERIGFVSMRIGFERQALGGIPPAVSSGEIVVAGRTWPPAIMMIFLEDFDDLRHLRHDR